MPEIDSDAFQVATLGLLLLILIVGLVALSTLGRIRKTLEETRPPGASDELRHGDGLRQEDETPAAGGDDDLVGGAGSAQWEPDPAAQPGTFTSAAGTASAPAAEEAPVDVAPVDETATERTNEPSEVTSGATSALSTLSDSAPLDDSAPLSGSAALSDSSAPSELAQERWATSTTKDVEPPDMDTMPEEQPFEKGGRWWFKRGDELLVYEEGTGQWVTAPARSGRAAASTPRTTETPSGLATEDTGAGSDTAATTSVWGARSSGDPTSDAGAGAEDAPEEEAEPGAFWRCPSCGTVNGSTATSCRMCFAAKP